MKKGTISALISLIPANRKIFCGILRGLRQVDGEGLTAKSLPSLLAAAQ